MSGHNKWSKIRHKKGTQDSRRSQRWTKRVREITVAAKLGGTDPAANARLRKALYDARATNVPKDTIARALQRVEGGEAGDLEELVYEGYGPSGVALLIECTTENRNRTGAEVKSLLKRHKGSLGATGSVSFMFDKRGRFVFSPSESVNEESLMEAGLEHGIDDVALDDDALVVLCAPNDYLNLSEAFENAEMTPQEAALCWLPQTMTKTSGEDAKILLKLIDLLEESDDVQNVWANFDIDSDELESLMS